MQSVFAAFAENRTIFPANATEETYHSLFLGHNNKAKSLFAWRPAGGSRLIEMIQ
jgi:hypothetical protein